MIHPTSSLTKNVNKEGKPMAYENDEQENADKVPPLEDPPG